MYLKIMFDRCYCINLFYLTIYLLKFGKLYFVIVSRQRASAHFFKYLSSWSERINRFKMVVIIRFDLDVSKMTVQGGCCTNAVVQNEIQIHQQKRRKAYLICNNFHAERAYYIPVPSCSSWKQKVCNRFSFTIVLLSF